METDDLNLMFGLGTSIAACALLVYLNSPATAVMHLSLAVLIGIGLPLVLSMSRLAKRFIPMIAISVAIIAQAIFQVISGGDLRISFSLALTVGLLVLYRLRVGHPVLSAEALGTRPAPNPVADEEPTGASRLTELR